MIRTRQENVYKETHTNDTDLQVVARSTEYNFFLLLWCLLGSHPFLI